MFRTIVFSILLALFATPAFSTNQFVVGDAVVSHDSVFIPIGVETDRDSLMTFEFVAKYHPLLEFLDVDWAGSAFSAWHMKDKGTNPYFAAHSTAVVYAFSLGAQMDAQPYINAGKVLAFTLVFKMILPVDDYTLHSAGCQYATLISHTPVFIFRTIPGRFEVVPVDIVSGSVPTDVEDIDGILPTKFSLSENYPNPFNPSTIIAFTLPKQSHVKLVILNSLGQTVATLCDEVRSPGAHTIQWNAPDYASGVYFYKMTTNTGYTETRKMMLLK